MRSTSLALLLLTALLLPPSAALGQEVSVTGFFDQNEGGYVAAASQIPTGSLSADGCGLTQLSDGEIQDLVARGRNFGRSEVTIRADLEALNRSRGGSGDATCLQYAPGDYTDVETASGGAPPSGGQPTAPPPSVSSGPVAPPSAPPVVFGGGPILLRNGILADYELPRLYACIQPTLGKQSPNGPAEVQRVADCYIQKVRADGDTTPESAIRLAVTGAFAVG